MRKALLIPAVLLAGCGGGGSDEPTSNVPEAGGLRQKVEAAQGVQPGDFPQPGGKTLQRMADEIGGAGLDVGLATSVFTAGENRLAFGVIDQQGQFVYGPTAIYVAQGPDKPAQGPYVAPADVLVTEGRYRSKQAASEQDPFAAVYAADVRFPKKGPWSVLVVTTRDGKLVAAASQVRVTTAAKDPIPDVGEPAPKVQTDTLASAEGDVSAIDTRVPPSDMHEQSFADVVAKRPVALLFSTPQLCQSRVCGPVTDVALQMKDKYGERMEFIHQEVYVGNDPAKGLRPPLKAFNLRTEPWLFVVGADGRITARLEGSFGLSAFERALQTAL